MIHIKEAIIVEGKYDKVKLESMVDTVVIATDGFGIFKDKSAQENIKKLAKINGAILLTDSDRAGFIIRKFLHDILVGCTVYDVYIPDVYGKERRKATPSAEGKLGVEGMKPEILARLLESFDGIEVKEPTITTADLYEWGLFGGESSAEKRRRFQNHLGLPGRLNKNMLLKIMLILIMYSTCYVQMKMIIDVKIILF